MPVSIKTPRGSIVKTASGTAQLTWNPAFSQNRTTSFNRKQVYIDSQVLRRCSPRVPFDTGMLEKSGILGTVVGSGTVKYIAPYAAAQYYNKHYDHSRQNHPDGGALWFERMKVADKDAILKGAEKA